MSHSRESTKSPVSRRLFLGAAAFCWAAFVFLTVCQVFRPDQVVGDPEKIKELAKASFTSDGKAANDWPQWRGPNRDGVATETGLLTTWPDGGPGKRWEKPTGEGYSSLVVVKGRLFTMFQEHNDEVIVCWDAETGREIWRHRYPAQFRNNFGNGPRSTPLVDGELLYSVGGLGKLTCLRAFAERPEVVWEKNLLEEFGAANLQWGVSFSPLVDGSFLYLNPGGPGGKSLVALDKYTGTVRWQTLDDSAGYSSPVIAELAGQRQVLFFTESGLVGVTPDQGKLLWRFPWTTQYGANIATPIVASDYVFFSSGYGKGCAMVKIDRTAAGFQANLVYKNKNMKTHFSSCVRLGDQVYGFNDTTLTCMEFRTGKVVWDQRGFDKGSLTIADGHLFILGEYGTVAVAEATPEGYREKGRFEFSDRKCWTVPVIANGRLYVRNEKVLACYELRK